MSAPTVVFDGAILAAGPITGVAGAFLTTLRAYAARGSCRCVLLVPPGVAPPALPRVEVAPGPFGRLARQRALPRVLRRLRADLLHCPVAALPLAAPCPVVATVHDLPWLAPVRLRERGTGAAHRLAVRLAARHAAAITVPSHATARQLQRYVGPARAAPVHVIPHGIAPPAAPAPEHALRGPFLVLGDTRPRKNLERVVHAHARARAAVPDLPDLLLVGPGLGYVDEARKLELLRGARALLHLALHEGFGLPVLEACAHGVPVVCADIESLREVAAGAALHARATDVAAMAAAIARIHRDAPLRAALRARGLQRAAELSAEASAAGWERLHGDVLGRAGARA